MYFHRLQGDTGCVRKLFWAGNKNLNHSLNTINAKPNASPLDPSKRGCPKQTHIFNFPVELCIRMQKKGGVSTLHPLTLGPKIPRGRGVTGCESRDPIETHAQTPMETQGCAGASPLVPTTSDFHSLSLFFHKEFWALTSGDVRSRLFISSAFSYTTLRDFFKCASALAPHCEGTKGDAFGLAFILSINPSIKST